MEQKKKYCNYSITIPTYRPDLQTKEDLVEEIIKIYGYNNFPSSLPVLGNQNLTINQEQNWKSLIRQSLSQGGYQEIITYSLLSEKRKKYFCSANQENTFYQLLTPKNENYTYYRHSLLASHLETIHYNLSHKNQNLLFFEISKIYYNILEKVKEEELLTLSATGKFIDSSLHKLEFELDYFWIKGAIERIFASLNLMEEISFIPSAVKELHPYQSADIWLAGKQIGFLGRVKSEINQEYQIKPIVLVAEISLNQLFTYLLTNNKFKYHLLSPFPFIERDLSLLGEENMEIRKVLEIIQQAGGELLRETKLFDVYQTVEYRKKKQKSFTFRLIFQSLEKTLLGEEIDRIMERIVTNIQASFKIKIRE